MIFFFTVVAFVRVEGGPAAAVHDQTFLSADGGTEAAKQSSCRGHDSSKDLAL